MKTKLVALFFLAVASVFAHGEDSKITGPNQGRVLTQLEPPAELFVTAGRKVRLTFIDNHGKPVAVPAALSATLITGDRSAPVTLAFAADGASLLSTTALPEGGNLPAVLRIKPAPDAAPVTVRIQLNLALCPACSRPEYACACDH